MIEYKTVKVECPDDKSGFEFVGETLNKHAVDGWEYIGTMSGAAGVYVNLKKVTEPQFLSEAAQLLSESFGLDVNNFHPVSEEQQHEPEHNRYSVPR